MIGNGLKQFYEAHGTQETVGKFLALIEDEKELKHLVDNFSLLEMAEAFHFPFHKDDWHRMEQGLPALHTEAVDFSAFPIISGQLLAKGVFIPAYAMIPDQSSKCVGEEIHEDLDPVRVPGWTAVGDLKKRVPGQAYDEATMAEKYVEVKMLEDAQDAGPFGRLITLKEEDIKFDRTGSIKTATKQLGTAAGNHREEEFFKRFGDETNFNCYYPKATQTAIYASGVVSGSDTDGMTPRASLKTSNALADATDVQNADEVLSLAEDENGKPIHIIGRQIIVPRKLVVKARIARHGLLQDKKKQGGVIPTSFVGGVGQDEGDDFEIVASAWLDRNTRVTGNSTWYWGDPRQAWVRNWVYDPQFFTVALGPKDSEYRKTDTIYVARARIWVRSFAKDYRFVVQNTA